MGMESKVEECESCGFTTRLEKYHEYNKEPVWACDLCASTMASRAVTYPEQFKSREVLQAICFVGNTILEKLSKGKP